MNRVILVHKDEYKYVSEYIESFRGEDEVIQYDASTKLTDDRFYLCVRRVPFELLPATCKIGFVNTEQLTVPSKLAEYSTFTTDSVEVFDYSQKNIELTGKGTYLPYNEVASETAILKEYMTADKKFNVAVVGSYTSYRDALVTSLRKVGFTVDFICEFGEARDKRVGQCSVLVNLHAGEEYTIYESARCERWRFAGMPIITEHCSNVVPEGVTDSTDLVKSLTDLLGAPPPPTCTIGLCMIVKNESHIIHEVLEATLGLIDTYCILDTGSTDTTIECINNFYAKTDVKGHVFQKEWKGFGASRSEALKLCDGKMDYILMIDADDLMCYPPGSKEVLKKILLSAMPNSCNVQIKRGTLDYIRTQIFKANDDWRYVGVLHEYPTNDKHNNRLVKIPSEIYMIGRCLGARSVEQGDNKYKRDAETLLKGVEEEPENERYVFYLAQSYRDAGMDTEALKWYKKRIEMGKWIEEVYISALNIARITNSKEWAWKAHEFSSRRTESLVSYASFCRANNMWSRELLSMIMYASTISMPGDQCLFIETDIYDWRVWDELAIIAYYLGEKTLSKTACLKLLNDNKFPDDQRARIEANLKYALS